MGLFDFLSGSEEVQLKRHAKRMTNINAQSEDRQASAHWLAHNGSPDAILGLLGRFSLNIDSQMKDANEKALIYDLLVDLGPKVCAPAREWMRKNASIAQPLRLVEHFEGREAVVAVLLDLLARENDPFKTEKKRQILIKLAEYRHASVAPAVIPVLDDFDEGVRYAAVEVLQNQEDAGVGPALARRLASPDEDSNRIRGRIAEIFSQRRWSLGEHAAAVAGNAPRGWQVQGDRVLPA